MYRGKLKRDLDRWVGLGIMPADAAAAALSELDSRPQTFTVGRVLMMLATVLVASALLLFVAANWDGLDRWVRVGLLIGSIWLFYGLATASAIRGSSYLPGVFLVLGASCFGAAIALIGQMFHLSGDGLSAAFIWFAMTLASAILYRSSALTYMAGLLSWFQFSTLVMDGVSAPSSFWFYIPFVQAVLLIALARYTGALRARHLAYILLLGWVAWVDADNRLPLTSWQIAILGLVLFLAAALPLSPLHAVARAAGAAPAFYAFCLTLLGMLLYQANTANLFGSGLSQLSDAWPAVATAAFAVLGIALEGRDNSAIRYLGYAVFAVELFYLAMEAAGTILGTSGLFLGAGLLLAFVAWVVIRLERRFAAVDSVKGA